MAPLQKGPCLISAKKPFRAARPAVPCFPGSCLFLISPGSWLIPLLFVLLGSHPCLKIPVLTSMIHEDYGCQKAA